MPKTSHFFLLCSALAAPLLGSSTAHAATFVSATGACLTVKDANTANGTRVQALNCFASFSQQWQWARREIRGIGTLDWIGTGNVGKCLDVAGGLTADGTFVQLYVCNGTSAQQWIFTNGRIINPSSARCLDVGNGSSQTSARIRTCDGSAGQNWLIRS